MLTKIRWVGCAAVFVAGICFVFWRDTQVKQGHWWGFPGVLTGFVAMLVTLGVLLHEMEEHL